MFFFVFLNPRYGQLSGMVEPIAGLFGAAAVVVRSPCISLFIIFIIIKVWVHGQPKGASV